MKDVVLHEPVWMTQGEQGHALVAAHVALDGLTPQQALERLQPCVRPFLLESGKGSAALARYSFLGADPAFTVVAENGGVRLCKGGRDNFLRRDPLTAMQRLLAQHPIPRPEGFPPFVGGFCGTFSYDLARRLERLPSIAHDDLPTPELDVAWYDRVVAIDHLQDRLWVICLPSPEEGSHNAMVSLASARIRDTLKRLTNPVDRETGCEPVSRSVGDITAQMSPERYQQMVKTAKDYIAAGDIFQANLSQRFSAPLNGVDPWALYTTLSDINPAPFAAWFDMGPYQVVSSSPERLVSLQNGTVEGRPIAGTRPRGADDASDQLSGESLLASDKERAEHVMLVDLMRNDLGKVCDYGSVRVSEFMVTERYSHVIHIVSNVVGQLGPGMDAVALLKAVFPGGTITGAPKVRCMEIIEELEPVRRGIYTGSAGYLSACGDMDLNILIRTVLVRDGVAYFQTGAGIVADSDPAAEFLETLHKAAAMRRALGAGHAVVAD